MEDKMEKEFQCSGCKKDKFWYEAPICESCGYDETEEDFKDGKRKI